MNRTYDKLNTQAFEYNIENASKLRELSHPFTDNFGIQGVCYFRYYKDGRMLRLGTLDEWTRCFFENQLYNFQDGDYRDLFQAIYNKEHLVIQSGEPQGDMSGKLFELGIWNSCGIFRQMGDSVEGFFLAGKKEDERVIDFFLNKRSLVNHFILYLKDKMGSEIKSEEGFIKTNLDINAVWGSQQDKSEHLDDIKILEATPIQNYYISTEFGDVSFTPREYQVMQHLSTGLTCKEIARELSISPRTVETYANSARAKVRCSTKSELIQLFKKYALEEKFSLSSEGS